MEKLSGILAASPRIKSVDMSDAKPTRPGAPNFGGPVGSTSVRDRVTLSSAAKNLAARETLLGRNPREAEKARIADRVTKDFFETRLKPINKETTVSEDIGMQVNEEIPVDLKLEVPEFESVAVEEPVAGPEDPAYEFATYNTEG